MESNLKPREDEDFIIIPQLSDEVETRKPNSYEDDDDITISQLSEQASNKTKKERLSAGRCETPPSVSFTIPVNKGSQSRLKSRFRPRDVLTQHDYFQLNKWYTKIDEVLSALTKTMKEYYASLYQEELHMICQRIAYFSRYLDVENSNAFDEHEPRALQADLYKAAKKMLIKLKDGIDSTQYAHILGAYMDTKLFIYQQDAERCKIDNWLLLRNGIDQAFKDKIEHSEANIFTGSDDMVME